MRIAVNSSRFYKVYELEEEGFLLNRDTLKHWDEPTLEATLVGVAQSPAILEGNPGQEAQIGPEPRGKQK